MDMFNATQRRKGGLVTKFLFAIAAVDEELMRRCPPRDWSNARAIGIIICANFVFEAAVYYGIANRLFNPAGELRVDLLSGACFLASFVMAIDSYVVMRSGWHVSGIAELKRGGIDISGGRAAAVRAGCFLAMRLILSLAIAQISAVFISLWVFGGDVNDRLQKTRSEFNAPLIATKTAQVENDIKRAGDAVTTQTSQVATLSSQVAALRQGLVDPAANDPTLQRSQREFALLLAEKAKADDAVREAELFATSEAAGVRRAAGNSGVAGYGPRYRAASEQVANAKARAQDVANELNALRARLDTIRKELPTENDASRQRSNAQLLDFEKKLASENARLTGLKTELSSLTRNRESLIRAAVESSPQYIGVGTGLLTQIRVLEEIANESPRFLIIILLIEVAAFTFEVAAVLVKTISYVPTTYAALLARETYLATVRLAEDMITELNQPPRPGVAPSGDKTASPPVSEPDPSQNASGHAPQPQKRGPGRPRKHPANGALKLPNGKKPKNDNEPDQGQGQVH